jgi:hypothetical protein
MKQAHVRHLAPGSDHNVVDACFSVSRLGHQLRQTHLFAPVGHELRCFYVEHVHICVAGHKDRCAFVFIRGRDITQSAMVRIEKFEKNYIFYFIRIA